LPAGSPTRSIKAAAAGVLARITELIKQRRPGLIVIDSFKALQVYAADAAAHRRFLHELAGRLSAMPITSFWVGEYDGAQASEAPEFAVADAIVSLSTERTAEREVRAFQVLKLRGSGFLTGKHSYRLSPQGLDVFPRLADPIHVDSYGNAPERISSGVPALDAMLTDGYRRGASTLVAGPSGVGKTLLTQHFVFAGARRGETGVIATFQENPTAGSPSTASATSRPPAATSSSSANTSIRFCNAAPAPTSA
jgi:circadian clock protein KaiC